MRQYSIGAAVYPSWKDAPDWGWKRIDGKWVEMNRPEPLFYDIHPTADDTAKMLSPDSYPPHLAKAVRAFNAPHTGAFRNLVSRGTIKALHLLQVLNSASEAADRLFSKGIV